jgi:hypothetical protein
MDKKKFERLFFPQQKKLGMVVYACHPSCGREHKYRRIVAQASLG